MGRAVKQSDMIERGGERYNHIFLLQREAISSWEISRRKVRLKTCLADKSGGCGCGGGGHFRECHLIRLTRETRKIQGGKSGKEMYLHQELIAQRSCA